MKKSVSYSDFEKLDFRVGEVVEASVPEWSNKLLRLEVDFGDEIGKRIIFSGIKKWYKPEDLVGQKYIFLVNMEPKKMGEEESEGMMIMADLDDDGVELIPVGKKVGVGTVVR
ncbi:methionine--tRNA ligase [Patescibacteria group bacterium]|nr:methionine--tRNA ligase [Patescibacteria group bacterium]